MSQGSLSARAVSADGMPAAALRWLEMVLGEKQNDHEDAASDNAALRMVQATNDYVRTIKSPINYISVVGPARSGKSTLLNMLSGSHTDLFPTSSGHITFTKGIFVTTQMFSLPEFSSIDGASAVQSDLEAQKVSFIDSEGTGAVGALYDLNLISPVLLCAKTVIYNRTGGLLTAQILSDLGTMTEAGKRLSTEQGTGIAQTKFGHLVILFNRFQLNANTNIDALRDSLLGQEAALDKAATERNEIRKLLQDSFASVSLYVLPDNQVKSEVLDEMASDPNRFLTLQDFRPKYQDYFARFRAGLSAILQAPAQIIPETPLTGGAIADFIPSFANAINTRKPLNVPGLYEIGKNETLNRAKLKFMQDFTNAASTYADQPCMPTIQLRMMLDKDLQLHTSDMLATISYMPSADLNKLGRDALEQSASVFAAAMDTNLQKIKTYAIDELTNQVKNVTPGVTDDQFGKMFLADLRSTFEQHKADVIASYEKTCKAYDPASLPDGYLQHLDAAYSRAYDVLKAKYERFWDQWINIASQEELDKLSNELAQSATAISAGDQQAWESHVATAVINARNEFGAKLVASYLSSAPDTRLKQFVEAAEAVGKTRTDLRNKNDAAVKASLQKQIDSVKAAYTNRLYEAISDQQVQPQPQSTIIALQSERDNLEYFISNNKLSAGVGKDALQQFDNFVSEERVRFAPKWTEAMNQFDRYFEAQLAARRQDWRSTYASSMGGVDLGQNVAFVQSQCEAFRNAATAKCDAFKAVMGSLQKGSVAALKLINVEAEVKQMTVDGEKIKLGQYDEAVALYNRALLNQRVQEIIDKSISETENYRNQAALDDALLQARNKFYNDSRKNNSSSYVQAWTEFYNRAYPALLENVLRNGSYVLDGKQLMPEELQRKIIDNIRGTCANMANTIGFSWINSPCFTNSGESLGLGNGGDATDPKREATRTFFLRNQSTPDGFWPDKKTNMKFFEWSMESSDYILGKPIISEQKPSIVFSNQYPALPQGPTFTGTTSISQSNTVTDSNQLDNSWGVKAAYSVEAEAPGVGKVGKSLELTYNGKFSKGWGSSMTNNFDISGSAPIKLPDNVACTVTQVGFDQKVTVPYTAKIKLVPRLGLTDGFVRMGGVYLKRDWFNSHQKGDRVREDFNFVRLDRLKESASRNEGVWDWSRFIEDGYDRFLNTLANPEAYTFYVRGRWEGVTGKMVITSVNPTAQQFGILPPGV